jgi:hypothetical protein
MTEDKDEKPERLSAILRSLAAGHGKDRISVGDLLAALEHRAIGALMFIFAVPNVLPTPPGTSSILGAPLIFLSAQLMLGRKPWLPGFISDRSLTRMEFEKVINVAAPWLERAEKLMRPRLALLARPPAEYVVGAICLLHALILILPIPLGNLPPAFAICLMVLGILERDGVWIILGVIASVIAVAIAWGVVLALLWSAWFVIGNWIGLASGG